MRNLIIVGYLILNTIPGIGQDLEEISSYEEYIYSPSTFYVLSEDTILTVELENKEAVLVLHDLKTNKIISSQRAGRGPGELSQNGVKYITKMGVDSIWVWDEGQRKGMIYDNNLNYIGDIVADDHSISSAIFLNDTTAITKKIFNGKFVAELHRLNNNRIKEEVYQQVEAENWKTFVPISDNPLLNQGPLVSKGGNAYLGFDYSSTVLSFSSEGRIDTLLTPDHVPFPIVNMENGLTAPDHAKSPLASLSIDSDEEHIYVLYSGKKFDDGPFKQVAHAITGRLADKIEESENATVINVYERKTGKFISSFSLPVLSKVIRVYGNTLYTLSYRDKRYQIIKFI